jgi:CheY-like chemotaxis protein
MDPKLVLVVDDEPDCVTFVQAILKDMGLDSHSATNGQMGLDQARAHRPDLIIMDVEMPVMSGFDAFKAMKEDPELKNIPVIMLTGIREKSGIGFSKEDMPAYFTEPPADYVEKPIEADKVTAAVKGVLNL